MTVAEVSKQVGYSTVSVSSVENGRKSPSLDYLDALYRHYGVNLSYIFSGVGEVFFKKPEASSGKLDTLEEMLFMVENIKMVRYAMLCYFINYKAQNQAIIDQLLGEYVSDERNGRENRDAFSF